MKNLHLIPTEKPSRLTKPGGSSSIKLYTNGLTNTPKGHCKNYHLYITSDVEIKVGDWVYCNIEGFEPVLKQKVNPMGVNNNPLMKKIILTTDTDLIKDGVQEIDEEFLEWFVKNSSCEEVEIANDLKYFNIDELRERHLKGLPHLYSESIGYKIVIPKEEPKQVRCYDKFNQLLKESDYVDVQRDGVHLIYKKEDGELYFKPYGEEDKVSAYFSNDIAKCDADGNWINNDRYEDIEPKQENCCTPAGQIKRYVDCKGCDRKPKQECKGSFKDCFKPLNECTCDTMKQETLEELAEKEVQTQGWGKYECSSEQFAIKSAFINGYQLAQERMYSEEEVEKISKELFCTMANCEKNVIHKESDFEKWFNQFKKK